MACLNCKGPVDKRKVPGYCPECGMGMTCWNNDKGEARGWCPKNECPNSRKNKPEGIDFWRLPEP